MNKLNLIRLGMYCQKKYNLPSDVKIMELADDYIYPVVRVIRKVSLNFSQSIKDQYAPLTYEEVELEVVGINDNFETVRVGYSYECHKLIIQERR